jgi:hypothetical protein
MSREITFSLSHYLTVSHSIFARMSAKGHHWGRILVRVLLSLLAVVFVTYVIIKSHRGGNDINVYLYAADQILDKEDLYAVNPYNLYLYSPLFALLLSPLTLFELPVARVVWALLNILLVFRLWQLLYPMTAELNSRRKKYWSAAVIILSLGFLNHNFALGQVTILLLWLTLEGAYQVARGKHITGSVLIALGINIKILPMLVLVWLGMKGHFRALTLTSVFFVASLFIPALLIGFKYNTDLLIAWRSAINPSGGRFAFEDNDGCHSLNAVLPAFLFDFETIERPVAPYKREVHYPRRIASVPYPALNVVLQLCRLVLIGLLIYALLPRSWLHGPLSTLPRRFMESWSGRFSGKPTDSMQSFSFYYEMALLCLVTLLIFPHQMKYSMLYFVPAGAYIMSYFFRKHNSGDVWTKTDTIVLTISIMLMTVLSIMGRDILGDHLVNVLDYYHFIGFSNLLFVGILWYCRPQKA